MKPVDAHALPPDVSFDGGALDCGNGLLLIRQHIDPMRPGQLLEIRSTETSVDEDLPAWCRLTGNDLVTWVKAGKQRSFLVCKGALAARAESPAGTPAAAHAGRLEVVAVRVPAALPAPVAAPAVPPLAVTGVGSWPRPRWMLDALERRLAGQLDEAAFEETARDAVRLAVDAQVRAGVDVLTDGEQRRDSYASFVGMRLDNVQLVPLADLTAMVDDPQEFQALLADRDVSAERVRHPVAYGPIGRSRPIAAHELAFLRTVTDRPVKVALPGPYVLTRTLWLECLRERAYTSRDALARDVVRVLREEVHELLAGGAALVQLDEPVLTDVALGAGPQVKRGFMCGALSETGPPEQELEFALELLSAVTAGLPRERLAMHVCRGNWSRDERVALAGDYRPLVDLLARVPVGTLFLEAATPRAGELDVLAGLPEHLRLGLGMVDQKSERIETADEVARRIERAVALFGAERLMFCPDCGFATYAHAPLAAAERASAKLAAIAAGVRLYKGQGNSSQ